eukprot:scaffold1079_cov112-Isochrysis_galbana.AAC.4
MSLHAGITTGRWGRATHSFDEVLRKALVVAEALYLEQHSRLLLGRVHVVSVLRVLEQEQRSPAP